MDYKEVFATIKEARETIRQSDSVIRELAVMATGRLRIANVGASVLADLKRELQDFNMHTWRWKAKK